MSGTTSAHSPVSAPPRLLVVDDDELARFMCGTVLADAGYTVDTATNGFEALALVEQRKPALILLDVDMSGMDGWQTLSHLRAGAFGGPVLMLSGGSSIENRVRGLSDGADDYLCKPCDMRELLARVNAGLRRTRVAEVELPMLRFGETTVDLRLRTAGSVRLTRTEYSLLETFARHPGRPLTREFLLEAVWGYTAEVNTRTVETHIWRLRGKLGDTGPEPRWIKSIPAAGYALGPEVIAKA